MSNSYRILSIDDSRAVHAFLDRSFQSTPHQLTHAMSAKEGLAILKAEMSEINLILLDWEMPEMNGPEALVEIRKLTQSIPVIMITTKNKPQEIQSMLDGGASEYILKPFTPDIILEKIQMVLGGN